ncbi:MAG TPA: carbohydrate kinase family protein [Rectinemataceae bacterium]|nr:carbohydrate kinase family protein [Rectinemataceae bacterium]
MGVKVDVLCVGNSAVDVPLKPMDPGVFAIDSYPVDRIIPTIGGSATNVSVIATRLGLKVALATLLGDDMLGKFILSYCRENGVDISSVAIDPGVDTPLSVGLVRADGERSFVVSRASSTFRFSVADIDFSRIADARLLDIASIFINPRLDNEGLQILFRKARGHGVIICADMMKSRDGKRLADIKEALSLVDYFFPNYEEASDLTGKKDIDDIANAILAAGVKNVVIKCGSDGCFVKNAAARVSIPSYRNESPVDTIGAGDNFVAGFLTAILEGADIVECARFANAVAAVSVGAPGATNGVRNRRQAIDVMGAHGDRPAFLSRRGGAQPS